MKKKLLITVVFIVVVILLQLSVFADMGAPEIKPYQAIVSNVNGAKYYGADDQVVGTLNYGDVINVSYEMEDWKTNKLNVYFTIEDNEYRIDINDIVAIEEQADNLELDYDSAKDLIVLVEEGLQVYKGPSYAYEKIGTIIPKGTELKNCLRIKDGYGNPWFYITYKNTSGWICELNGAVGYKSDYEDYKIVTYKSLKLYKTIEEKEVVGIVPANTTITDFLEIDEWSQGSYITYEGISGYATNYNYATNCPWSGEDSFKYTVSYPAKMYKEGNLRSEVLIEEIPEGTELEYTICSDIRATGWFYTTYNDIGGWIFYIEGDSIEDYQTFLDDELKNSEEIINVDNLNESKNNTLAENINTEIEEYVEEENNNNKVSGKQIVLICIMFAIVIALTSFVTILLVNKKNKKE